PRWRLNRRSPRAAPPEPSETRGAARVRHPRRRGSAPVRPRGRGARPDRTSRRRPPDGWRPWAALSSLERAHDPFERYDHGLAAAASAAPGEPARPRAPPARPRPGEAPRADGLFGRPACRPRHPGDGHRNRSLAALERAARHLARGFLADGAVRLEGVR